MTILIIPPGTWTIRTFEGEDTKFGESICTTYLTPFTQVSPIGHRGVLYYTQGVLSDVSMSYASTGKGVYDFLALKRML